MKNIHLLPTDKPSRLFDFMTALVLTDKVSPNDSGTNHHIYITSDEKIKKDDWFIHPDSSCFDKEWKEVSVGGYEILKVIKVDEDFIYHSSMMAIHKNLNIKKIILTTDTDLIADGVQPIEDYFLEWFVKNRSFEEVKVDLLPYDGTKSISKYWGGEYKIIIPQEQLDYTALLQPVGTRQETIEETYLNQLIDEANKEFTLDRKLAKDVAVKYANWQSERMYSKEEVIAIVEKSRETGLTAEYLLLTDQFKKK